jgi:hydroxymethylpyrimidine kinase/phosphomethylpyrimidine kinase
MMPLPPIVTPPVVLSIAGSDPSGGAGIQADLKTFTAHNVPPPNQLTQVYGMAVITALTSQNTTGVSSVHVIPAEFVRNQIEDVVPDIPPKCIKTGNAIGRG